MSPGDLLFVVVWIVATFSATFSSALTVSHGNLTKPGDSVTLSCQTDQPNIEVQFLRKGIYLATDKSGKYSINGGNDNVTKTLTVNQVGEQDLGEYLCRVTSTQEAVSVFLYSKPVVSAMQVPTNLIEGESLRLTCSTWGFPTPKCTWLRGDRTIASSDPGVSFARLMTSSNASVADGRLTIERMNRSDQTDYTCSASGGGSKTNVTVYVRVKDRLAAVWPSIGITIVIVFTIVIIVFAERRRRKDEAKMCPQ